MAAFRDARIELDPQEGSDDRILEMVSRELVFEHAETSWVATSVRTLRTGRVVLNVRPATSKELMLGRAVYV